MWNDHLERTEALRDQENEQTSRHGRAELRLWGSAVSAGFATLVGVYLWLRIAGGNQWPKAEELPVKWSAAAGDLLLLIAAAGAMRRAVGAGRSARAWIGAAVMLGLCTVAVRGYRYQRAVRLGLAPEMLVTMVFDRPNLTYLKAVRARLKELGLSLDALKADSPEAFGAEQAERLATVEQLERDMVAWSELEVARWLDDTRQRRGVLLVTAYLVYPLARDRAHVGTLVATERRRLDRTKERLVLLNEYCLAKLRQYKESDPADTDGGTDSDVLRNAEGPIGKTVRPLEQLEPLVRSRAVQTQGEVGRMIRSILKKTVDARSTVDALTLVQDRLKRIDSRRRFVRDRVGPILTESPVRGLDARLPWLRLPMRIPDGRRWQALCYLLLGLHTLLLLAVLTMTAWRLIPSRNRCGSDFGALARFWYLTVSIGWLVTAVLYLV